MQSWTESGREEEESLVQRGSRRRAGIQLLILLPYLLRWGPPITISFFCILSYFSNPSSGSPKAEVPLAFYPCQMGGPEEVLC
ncbi:hypothetical protein E2C01_079814 [Portunus trituberculatus]|uniref:Uncharacterized protein n=1 Tax=Portunus trituberculatus TaxID=210409 RepID=A0A5B7ITT0_PORTR|nr:hypothetical protein [Portunus trituberculatus]